MALNMISLYKIGQLKEKMIDSVEFASNFLVIYISIKARVRSKVKFCTLRISTQWSLQFDVARLQYALFIFEQIWQRNHKFIPS